MELEDLKKSEKELGQIYPVIKNAKGEIIDGYHRKRVNPKWKEIVLPIDEGLGTLRMRVHLNLLRRPVPFKEQCDWVSEARRLIGKKRGIEPFFVTQKNISKELKTTQHWVSEHDVARDETIYRRDNIVNPTKPDFYGYNVWGFRTEKWREQIILNDPNQPDKEFYHGSTPAFVIHQLIKMFNPKRVLDSMAGVGTTGYVCLQYNVECDQFDVYPYPKFGVGEGDAEFIDNGKKYDLIFNHIPYLDMVRYGEHEQDLSTMNEREFFAKMKRIFQRNYELLEDNGIYAILVGDWRFGKRLIPITARTTVLAHECGFVLQDEAIKLSAEQKGDRLQRYRATEFGYLAQTFDMVLMFKKKDA